MRNLSTLLSVLFFCISPYGFAQAYHEVDQCQAGKIMDINCVKKHQAKFEKYVIRGEDWKTQKEVADVLVEFYRQTGQESDPKVKIVLAKEAAYQHAKELEAQIFRSHYSPCEQPCNNLNVSSDIYEREKLISLKHYFESLDPGLYKGEIKGLNLYLRLASRP